ncbi:MAG: hypothetical protein LBJ00_01935 [Planctomycetaceae bacterium]|nr:hypothetical protein [Planctomycetaceae bacterium]
MFVSTFNTFNLLTPETSSTKPQAFALFRVTNFHNLASEVQRHRCWMSGFALEQLIYFVTIACSDSGVLN